MKGKTVLSALLAAIMILTIAASAVAATDDGEVTAFATTTCDSCSDCTKKLNGDYDTVVLTTDLINVKGSGITFGADNVVFDGGGHKIDGDDSGEFESGITINGKSGNTIKNCVITDFESGITLYGSSKNEIYGNEISSNYYDGIWISEESNSNNIHDNVIEDNGKYGVFFSSNSNGNTFSDNTVCSNPTDIHDSDKNSGDENVCDTTDNWNDAGTTGCTRDCASRKPDLVITDISNDDGTICYEIKNIGDATASEGHRTTLFVNGLYQIKEQVDLDLAPGASVERCFDYYTWNCTPPEDVVEVCADYGDFVDESDEENNCLNVTWTCTSPASPGDAIIYHADHGAGIWRIDPDGSGNTQLSDHGWFAEYSPDNSKIAFGEYYQNGIWVMNADGTGQVQLTSSGNAPTWSPDGTKIAYHVGGTTVTARRIWVMDADGSNAQKLSDSPGYFPAWSPDGTKIAYNGEVDKDIRLINPDGTGDIQLCADGSLPAWSPDGKKIAYRSSADGCIWTMDAEGSGKTKISTYKGKVPAWSPDGTKIAYEGTTGIWVIGADGTDEHLINQGGHAPDWMSPGIVEELPDLVITYVWNDGDTICYKIKNIGDATAQKGHYTTLHVDGAYQIKEQVDVDLAPGASVKRRFDHYSWSCTSPEDKLKVCADCGDSVDESNEKNNCREETWQCVVEKPVRKWIPFIPEAAPGALHGVKHKSSDNTGIAVDSDIPGMYSVNVPVEGAVYQRLDIPYAGHTTAIGKPKVPIIRRYLEVPYDVNLAVEVLYSNFTILDGYNVYPAQEPLSDMPTNETSEFVIDNKTYSYDTFYPSNNASVGEPVIMRGHRIIPLVLFPVQHNPVTEQLRVYSKIEVRIKYSRPAQIEGIEERFESDAFESLGEAFILNYKPADRYPTRRHKDIGSPSADYLIITHDDFATQVEPLADWKEKKGLRTEIVNTSDICTNAAVDDVDEITDYLQNAYDTWNPPPTYVLLVGDSESIPTHYQTPHYSDCHGGFATATDLYYGTLDGNDRFPDIFLGRISVDTAAQATTIVNKILNYERNPPSNPSFYNDISVVAHFQDSDDDGFEDRRFVLTSEEIRDYLDAQGYNVERIYNTNSAVSPTNYNNGDFDAGIALPLALQPPFPWNGNTADITATFNAGRFIVNYRGHGGSRNYWDERPAPDGQWQGWFDGWGDPSFTTANILGLNNANELPVVFIITCQSGWFDGETDPYAAWNFECFCEEMLRYQNGGAVAAFGATRNSPSGYNDDLVRGFYDAIWPDFDPTMTGAMFELGQIHTYGKVHMAVTPKPAWGTADVELTVFEEFHLFGDPEMWIWTAEPQVLTVTHPSTIGSGGVQEFVVNVQDAGGPVHNAAVCLRKANDIHVVEYTDPDGNIIFSITPSTGGDMDITVTAHNYRPYEGVITVTDNGATISLSPNIGPEGISVDITGSDFDDDGETVDIEFGGTPVDSIVATAGSFSDSFTVPDVPEGPTNVVAVGQDSERAAIAVFRVLPDTPLPDLYTYCQWDSSTWHLEPTNSKRWNSPSIQLYEGAVAVESDDLMIGTTYTIKAEIYNSGPGDADGTTVTFKWALWGAGQGVWDLIGTDTVNVPALGGPAEASVLWTPTTTGHVCIVVEIHHPWDSNLDNNKGQENTHVEPIASPAEIPFVVENPTDNKGLVYLELTQTGQGPLWGTRIDRKYPQILEPGERQTARITVYAPDDATTGDTRVISVTASIDGEMIGGVEISVVVNQPPVLSGPEIIPDPHIVGQTVTFTVVYTDKDNHAPIKGYPKLSIFKGGVLVSGSPFTMNEADPTDADHTDGKIYTYPITFSEPGDDYTYFFYASDGLTHSVNTSIFNTSIVEVGAAPGAKISIADVTVSTGGSTILPVMIYDMTNFGAATVALSYDPAVVHITDITAGDVGTPIANIDNATGTATIAAYVSTVTGPDSPITFANLELLAVGNSGETSPLTLGVTTLTDVDGTSVSATTESGVFTIRLSGLRGDANDDGVVNVVDAMFVAQYAVGNRDASTLNMANADANLDGTVDVVDAMFIAQYAVGARTW